MKPRAGFPKHAVNETDADQLGEFQSNTLTKTSRHAPIKVEPEAFWDICPLKYRKFVINPGEFWAGTFIFTVFVNLKSDASVKKEDKILICVTHPDHRLKSPLKIKCARDCQEEIGSSHNVILIPEIPGTLGKETEICWYLEADGIYLPNEEARVLLGLMYRCVTQWFTYGQQTVNTKPKTLTPGVKYRFMVKATNYDIQHSQSTSAIYTNRVESPPEGKGCSITPTEGRAALTRFTVSCLDYIDTVAGLPLIYRLYQFDGIAGKEDSIFTLLAYSANSEIVNITLSTKGGSGVKTIDLFVEVKNVKGTGINVPMSITLNTLDQQETLDALDEINGFKISGGGQEDARAVKDVATIISFDSSVSLERKMQVRKDVLSNLCKLDIDSADNIEHVSHVLDISVARQDEIDPSGLDNGIRAASRLAKHLGKVSNTNADATKNVAEMQVNAISRLLYIASEIGRKISTLNETEVEHAPNMKKKNIHQSILATDSFSNIAAVLLNSITSVNDTVEIRNEFMDFYLCLYNISEKSTFNVESEQVKFYLPTMDSGVGANELVESEFEAFKKNPYGWTANHVKGDLPVVKVNLVRQQMKYNPGKQKESKVFRFSKPADIFLDYNDTGEEIVYNMAIKVVKRHEIDIISLSSCIAMSVKVSTESATALKITSPNNMKIMVKSAYTNIVSYFDELTDEDMLEMPLSVPETLSTPNGVLNRDKDLIYLPQMTKQQQKRNRLFFRIKISFKLGVPVYTGSLTPLHINTNDSRLMKLNKEEPGEFYNLSLHVTPYTLSCMHFDVSKNDYVSDECKISMYTNLSMMHCRCVIAATFTGSMFVVPRLISPLDFDLFYKVFDNPLVVSMVIAVWLFYFAFVAWGRQKDKEDETKNRATVLDDNKEEYEYVYLLCVVTGWSTASATTSNVYICLKGSWSESESHVLQDPARILFQSGAENWFVVTTKGDIGELMYVVVWSDFSGAAPSWFLTSVYVQNMQTKESWICMYNSWISEQYGRGQLLVEVPAVKESEYSSWVGMHIIRKGHNDLRNEHLWIGIIAKTSYNKFTRVRRLTTALSILQTLMILNMVFFGIRDKDDPGQFTEVLDQKIHLTSVIIGVQTAFIVFVLGVAISMLFNKIHPYPKADLDGGEKSVIENLSSSFILKSLIKEKPVRTPSKKSSTSNDDDSEGTDEEGDDEGADEENEETDEDKKRPRNKSANNKEFPASEGVTVNVTSADRNQNSSSQGSKNKQQSVPPVSAPPKQAIPVANKEPGKEREQKPKQPGQEPKAKPKPPSGPYMLPWWFIYVTWILIAGYNVFLAYYIMLYGLSLGYNKSLDWIVAFFSGFFINVCLIQPLKVLLMVILLVLVFRQKHSFTQRAPVTKLNEGLQLVKERKRYNRKHKILLPKVTCKAPVHSSEARLVLARLSLERNAKIILRDLFIYTIYMIAVLIVTQGHLSVNIQFYQNRYVTNVFLGAPTVQDTKVRVKDDMWHYIKTVITPGLTPDKNETLLTEDFYLMGTARLRQVRTQNSTSEYSEPEHTCDFMPRALLLKFYDRSCTPAKFYVTEETKSYDHTWEIVSNFSSEELDDSPYVYRSPDDVVAATYIGIHGFYPGGGYIMTFSRDDSVATESMIDKLRKSDWIDSLTRCVFVEFTLYNPGTNHFTRIVIAFEFGDFGTIFPVSSITTANMLAEGRKYWWVVHSEIFTIVLTGFVVVFFFLRYNAFVKIMKVFQIYGHSRFIDFSNAFKMHISLQISLAWVGALVIFKMLKVTIFNPFVKISIRTFINCAADFYGLFLITALLIVTLASAGLIFFGRALKTFMSFDSSLYALIFFILNESDYAALVSADIIFGRAFFLIVNVTTQYIIVNIFTSILHEGFELTRYMSFKTEKEILRYVVDSIKFYLALGPENVRVK